MRPKPQTVSESIPEENLSSLRACLVEGDPEQRHREQKIRRRALAVSIALQSTILAVLVLVPLFGKTERIAAKEWIPLPPYGRPNQNLRRDNKPTTNPPSDPGRRVPYDLSNSRPHLRADGPMTPGNPTEEFPAGPGPIGPPCDGCIPIGSENSSPRPPQPPLEPPTRPQLIHTQLDPAMLRHRVEPVYPTLAIQTHKEGRVELRAIIATDGTIKSLQIVSGDPIFYISAKEAVEQWLYKPTYLNGQAVEIDTFITVVYTMKH
jgi:TonB family protein